MRDDAHTSTQDLLVALWKRNQPLILERLAQLDSAALAAQAGAIPEELRELAESNAHKLSGTLGMFGYHEGTTVARELEHQLQQAPQDPAKLNELTRNLRDALYPPSL